jgi:hypothetical protein
VADFAARTGNEHDWLAHTENYNGACARCSGSLHR